MNIIEYLFLSMKQYFIYVNTLYFIAAGFILDFFVNRIFLLTEYDFIWHFLLPDFFDSVLVEFGLHFLLQG